MDISKLKSRAYLLLTDGRVAMYIKKVKAPGSGTVELRVLLASSLIKTTIPVNLPLKKLRILETDWKDIRRHQLKIRRNLNQAMERI